MYLEDYFFILIFILFCIFLKLLLLVLSYSFALKNNYFEKLSSYECGFEPFDDVKKTFDIHFYIVAILFLIFDIEIIFLFPWAVSLNFLGFFGYFSMFIFLMVLILGFFFEWNRDLLNWSSNKKLKC